MMRRIALILGLCLVATGGMAQPAVTASVAPAAALEAAPLAADPVADKRLQALSAELRCLVCQNQTIADSNAELAVDLRREITGMIQAGRSDQEILDFMVTRYGDFVLYRPPVKGITLLLWGGPVFLLVLALYLLRRYLQQRAARLAREETGLTAAEQRRAEHLLNDRTTP